MPPIRTHYDRPGRQPMSNDRETRRQRAQADVKKISKEPFRDRARLKDKTEEQRLAKWSHWRLFASDLLEIDPEQVWTDLCDHDDEAAHYICAFLLAYARDSGEERVQLSTHEGEETKWVASVNTAVSIMGVWRDLVMWADEFVLQPKRAQDPKMAHRWRLSFTDAGQKNARNHGPIFKISLWIRENLVEELQLNRNQTFTKVSSTAEDIVLYVDTLWRRAEDIPCPPELRVSAHAAILLMGIGGFRPGTIMQLPFRQVEMAVVRDPVNRAKVKLVAKITIYQNKQSNSPIKKKQDDVVSITLTIVPWPLLCLLSLLLMRAFQLDAFEVPFRSLDEILERPNMKGVDFVPLRWKSAMLDKPILEIKYKTFYDLWNRILLVAGIRERPRLYSLRVGAGGRLHESLKPHLCDYILGHTPAVFQASYQPIHINEDLPRIAFSNVSHFENLSKLYALVANSSVQRDENAPIYPTQNDAEEWEKRSDLIQLRAQYAEIRKTVKADDTQAKRIAGWIQAHRDLLKALTVEARRTEYFEKVDNLRATGQQVPADVLGSDNMIRRKYHAISSRAAAVIGQFLGERDHTIERSPASFIQMGVKYLQNLSALAEELALEHIQTKPPRTPLEDKDTPSVASVQQRSKCLLCNADFCDRRSLTRHTHVQHMKKAGQFLRPFQCPECVRLGVSAEDINGSSAWSNHAERQHGIRHAPYASQPSTLKAVLESKTCHGRVRRPKAKKINCLLCGLPASIGNSYSRHTNRSHKQNNESQMYCCNVCKQSEHGEVSFQGFDLWMNHALECHGRDGQTGQEL